MNYYKVVFSLNARHKGFAVDILKNDLLQIGFESFVDIRDNIFEAYCPENSLCEENIQKIIDTSDYIDKKEVKYDIVFIEDRNWNQLWEETSPSVVFGNFCHIRKENQPTEKVKYDIIINPEQSFGTANHQTTAMIISYMSVIGDNMKGKFVMDMGCGTAVLGILAKKMGAGYVECIDIDTWAYNNALSNAEKNSADIVVKLGGSECISKDVRFDIFMANINLNILIDNKQSYTSAVKDGGLLILSGFFDDDTAEIIEEYEQQGMSFYHKEIKDGWALLVLKKMQK